ncbi:MAG: hypothetical protein AAFX99_26120, partial [Myxococcota bacterium]
WLDRPVGVLTGWSGYEAPTCNSLQTVERESYSYPVENGYDGVMHHNSGTFLDCNNSQTAYMFTPIYKGSSGGGVFRMDGTSITGGVWSFYTENTESGEFQGSYMQRIRPWFSNQISFHRDNLRDASETDLYPMWVRSSNQDLMPELGNGHVDDVRFVLYNQGGAMFTGDVTANFYLLPRDWSFGMAVDEETEAPLALDEVGLPIGSYTFQTTLESQEPTLIHVPNGTVVVPEDVFEWDYALYGEHRYQLGVVLDVQDDKTWNNAGCVTASGRHDHGRLNIYRAQPDLAFGEVSHSGSIRSGLSGPLGVGLEVLNLGEGSADPWRAHFYLSKTDHIVVESGSSELIFLGSGTSSPIAAGGNFQDSFFLSIPDHVSGDYYLYIYLTANDDSDLGNNSYFSEQPITFSNAADDLQAAPADLRVSYFMTGSGEYTSSDELPIDLTVANIGGSGSGDWAVQFYAVRNPLTQANPVYLGQLHGANAISGGDSSAFIVSLDLDPLGSDTWWVLAEITCANDAYPSNNTSVASTYFEIPFVLTNGGGSSPERPPGGFKPQSFTLP